MTFIYNHVLYCANKYIMQIKPSLSSIIDAIYAQKIAFFLVFFSIVFLTYAVLYMVDFLPEAPTPTVDEVVVEMMEPLVAGEEADSAVIAAEPLSIYIEKLNKEIVVLNPVSSSIADLDEALLSGVVRHPYSADFTEPGNIFILGHSSHLPNVLNRNFQAFNGIEDLTWGDKIYLESADATYTYRVDRVYEAKASELIVPFTPGEARLTLATCNSFGSTDDRFIVEAVLISDSLTRR